MKDHNERTPRRTWLITMGRHLALGGIGLLGWSLGRRSASGCPRLSLPCQECVVLAHCSLPRAQAAQQQQQSAEVTP